MIYLIVGLLVYSIIMLFFMGLTFQNRGCLNLRNPKIDPGSMPKKIVIE